MGRSLEVRGKSENLPVIGCTLVGEPVSPGTYNNVSKSLICFGAGLRNGALMFSRDGTQVQVSGLMLLAEIFFGMDVKKPPFLSWERRFFYWFLYPSG